MSTPAPIAVTLGTLVLSVAARWAAVIGVVVDSVILSIALFEPRWMGLAQPID